MKWLPGIILSFFILSNLSQGQESSMEIYFPTTGNCYLCKVRIENAVSKLTGVESVNWDAGTDITHVTYDESLVDAYQVMQVIAHVGHETEWYPANDSAYASLKGTCCYYTKTIDYTNAQPGYLGLLGIWVWPLTGIDPGEIDPITISGTPGSGQITLRGNSLASYDEITVEAYGLNGRKVFRTIYGTAEELHVNLIGVPGGLYLLTARAGENVLLRTKVITH